MEPHIVCIEKFEHVKQEDTGSTEARIKGAWFLRPNETYHLPTRKFLHKVSIIYNLYWLCQNQENLRYGVYMWIIYFILYQQEVFKSDFSESVPLSKVLGKCYVMFVKDYFKNRPEAFQDKDVYVCESRYSGKHKSFKKIKVTLNTPKLTEARIKSWIIRHDFST